jgi:hypothetical protein
MIVLALVALLSSALMGYALSKPPPSSRVEVVEVSRVDNNKMEIVIRNRGSAPAFIKGVQLVLGPMSCGSNVCMPGLGFTKYEYDVELSNEKTKILHKNIIEVEKSQRAKSENLLGRIEELAKAAESAAEKQTPAMAEDVSGAMDLRRAYLQPKHFEVLTAKEAADELKNRYATVIDNDYYVELNKIYLQHLKIAKTPVLRLSYVVPENEVQKVRLDLNFVDKNMYLSACINSCAFQAYAILFFDETGAIRTSTVTFGFSNL